MAKDFNHHQIVEHYDEHIRKLIPGYELIHQQIQTLLALNLANSAHILIVGCGTGQELITLAQAFPHWQFTAIDPAEQMLITLQKRLDILKLPNRIQLIHGNTSILENINQKFDAALCILVAHFIENKKIFYAEINQVLAEKSLLISCDLIEFKHDQERHRLAKLAELTGLHAKQSQIMLQRFNEDFHLTSIEELQQLYYDFGFKNCEIFCKIFNYYSVIAYKA